MIYFVSNNPDKPIDSRYAFLSVEESLNLFNDVKVIQVDTETSGLNPHIMELMTLQLGSDVIDTQVVIDCTTVKVELYKSLLESKMLVLHNAKFDLQYFFKHNIIPRRVYDTMIAEQMLYLGYKAGTISYALKALADRYLQIDLDKTVRGQIRWRGIDAEVIVYGARDVMHLEKIMWKQVAEAKKQRCLRGIKIECEAVPAVAYMEWCGIHLDAEKWQKKIEEDTKRVEEMEEKLNEFVINLNGGDNPFSYLDPQGDLFAGFAEKPVCTINWDSPAQVIKLAKYLGFNTEVKDKKTGELKDSVLEKSLKIQKGINDEFLNTYFGYKEPKKALSAFGQGHINAINPITGNLHTSWHQIGTASARMSCGEGTHPDEELAKLKGLPAKACPRVNLQQLPADDPTRGSFTSRPGYKIVSADFSAEESRLAADIYNEPVLLEEFLHGSGDAHSVFAKAFFPKELEGIDVKDIATKRPDLRKRAKGKRK